MEEGEDSATISASPVGYIRSRIANACDGCKARKVKCDGGKPCGYCSGRQRPQACHYSAPQRRRRHGAAAAAAHQRQVLTSPPLSARQSRDRSTIREASSGPASSVHIRHRHSPIETARRISSATISSVPRSNRGAGTVAVSERESRPTPTSPSTQHLDHSAAEDETEVPREARLLQDSHGKLTFIGDCAPLSFFQSVRRLVTSRVGPNAFAPQSSRFSVLENAPSRQFKTAFRGQAVPDVRTLDIPRVVSVYLSTTIILTDLFDNSKLLDDLTIWASLQHKPDNVMSVVYSLVLAIGLQPENDALSYRYFEYARDQAYVGLSDSLGVETVQAFILITIYMLCSSQINGAFLFFGIAARAAYSIGLHRTEVNARFGSDTHRQRDRLWKSLRAVDLFLSSSMGRPAASSDVDCTVPYRALDADGVEEFDLLNASVQILLLIEYIILEIYSRKKISMKMTEGISLQLREWSKRWLSQLKEVIAQPEGQGEAQMIGACQVLSSYYYAVMLVSRPFLMYELCQRLVDDPARPSGPTSTPTTGKSKLADACIDAASLMVDPILDLINRDTLRQGKAPLLVSWLFAASLVLGVGLLGGFGRTLEKNTRMSIQVMNHFAQSDAHAKQYSLIAESLLSTAVEHIERKELQERLRRTESSSQLFGLIVGDDLSPRTKSPAQPRDAILPARTPDMAATLTSRASLDSPASQHHPSFQALVSPRLGEIDPALMGLSEPMMQTPDTAYWESVLGSDNDPNSALNLFPLLESGGGIDLTHWL